MQGFMQEQEGCVSYSVRGLLDLVQTLQVQEQFPAISCSVFRVGCGYPHQRQELHVSKRSILLDPPHGAAQKGIS